MAKLSAHGTELARYFSPKNRGLVAVMGDGTRLLRRMDSGWTVIGRKKAHLPMDEWVALKLETIAKLPGWCRDVRSLPSMRTLEEWQNDSMCETVTGDRVEPDGVGPDGAPSWLIALGFI